MAVEARHFNLFPLQERDLVNSSSREQMYYSKTPISNESQVVCDSMVPKSSINTESGDVPGWRKRCRDYAGPNFPAAQKSNFVVGQNVLPQYQFDIDTIVSQHSKRMKLELQERQKQQTRLIIGAMGEGAMKKLKEKDEQIQSMVKLNMILQERVKSLYVENQLWREVAQTNEATTISLRTNLEHALARVGGTRATVEEEESCCDSSDTLYDNSDCGKSSERRCRQCGEREARVLLLPCRHLCLCDGCGSGSHQPQTCPVCNSTMNATLHVNM